MKLFPQSIIILLLISVLPSCKKGENDPFLSLRTRKARICGEWKVTNEEGHIAYSYHPKMGGPNSDETIIYHFNGEIKTTTDHITGVTFNTTMNGFQTYESTSETIESYTESYSFEKNGEFRFSHLNSDNSKIEYGGIWAFLSKNELENLQTKNKEAIKVIITSYIETNADNTTVNSDTPTELQSALIYKIDRLSHKEIILKYDPSFDDPPSYSYGEYSSSKRITTSLSLIR